VSTSIPNSQFLPAASTSQWRPVPRSPRRPIHDCALSVPCLCRECRIPWEILGHGDLGHGYGSDRTIFSFVSMLWYMCTCYLTDHIFSTWISILLDLLVVRGWRRRWRSYAHAEDRRAACCRGASVAPEKRP
jgi:hypothetical protein